MRITARLRLDEGLGTEQILQRNLQQNLFQYPTERELPSITRACCLRLDNLSQDPQTARTLTAMLAHGQDRQARQTNLYAMARTYRVVYEFLTGVIAPKFQRFDHTLRKPEVERFLDGLRAQDAAVAGWSPATMNKIRQVLMKCLVEAGFMESVRSGELTPPLLDLDLERAMEQNGDAALPAAFGRRD